MILRGTVMTTIAYELWTREPVLLITSSALIRKQQLAVGERIGEDQNTCPGGAGPGVSGSQSVSPQPRQRTRRDEETLIIIADHGQVVMCACSHYVIALLVSSPHLWISRWDGQQPCRLHQRTECCVVKGQEVRFGGKKIYKGESKTDNEQTKP